MRYHFVGIGGSGLSAIARVLLERGERVTGSDLSDSAFLDSLRDLGAEVFIGHRAEQVADADAVIVSSAVHSGNPELVAAVAAGIPIYKRSDFFGPLTEGKRTIAVSGTHGKTTTTGEIAFVMTKCGLDPTFIVGGALSDFACANARAGQGEWFVIEADEYDRAFLGLAPWMAVVTNVEHDHPDCFPTLDDLRGAFTEFLARVQPGGYILVCAESQVALQLADAYRRNGGTAQIVTYAARTTAEWMAGDVTVLADGACEFEVLKDGHRLGRVRTRLPGLHNVNNTLAALCAAHICGVPFAESAQAAGLYHGAERRFEVKGQSGGITIVDDYAHHPSEIRATLAAARQRFPGRRIWAVWQPHTYSRTRTLENDFIRSFEDADRVMVLPVYRAREPFDPGFSAEDLIRKMAGKEAYMIQGLDDAVTVLDRELRSGDVMITMSAGDANRVGEVLLRRLRSREARQTVRLTLEDLRARFGNALMEGEMLSRFTSARVGGPADALLEAGSAEVLAEWMEWVWAHSVPCLLLGSGSNVLVSDAGCRELVIINRAKRFEFRSNKAEGGESGSVWAESGASIGAIARQAAQIGWSGMEWAATVPGTVGGAVVGNAGAFGGDTAGSLLVAEILQRTESDNRPDSHAVRMMMDANALEFGYRTSRLKRLKERAVVLSAEFKLTRCDPSEAVARIGEFVARRKSTQPQGASLGSMFKNPPGDFAGRLIEAVGLKGKRMGNAEIPRQHANFFLNLGEATAQDITGLLELARQSVKDTFGVTLELEIERLGEWPAE